MLNVKIKRKGALQEGYYSEDLAVVQDGGLIELTMTQTIDEQKRGAKFILQRGDKITITHANDNPKDKR